MVICETYNLHDLNVGFKQEYAQTAEFVNIYYDIIENDICLLPVIFEKLILQYNMIKNS